MGRPSASPTPSAALTAANAVLVNRQVNTAVKHGLLVKARTKGSEPYRFMCSTAGDRQFEQTLETTLGVSAGSR